MTEHPILIPTSKGPVGGVVGEPESEPRAAVVLFQGGGPAARCGVNAIWTRIGRRLVAAGALVLRFDFGREGDSTMAGLGQPRGPAWRSAMDLPITREVSAWFRERADMGLLVAGSCYGARLALEVAAEDDGIEGVFLATPYLAGVRRRRATPQADAATRAALEELPNPPQNQNDSLGAVAIDSSLAILSRGRPLWMLIGEKDPSHALELRERLAGAEGGELELEVAPGIALHPGADPTAQSEIADRIVARVQAALREHAGR